MATNGKEIVEAEEVIEANTSPTKPTKRPSFMASVSSVFSPREGSIFSRTFSRNSPGSGNSPTQRPGLINRISSALSRTLSFSARPGEHFAGEENVPKRYLQQAGGNAKKAHQNWHRTLKWRKENNIDTILDVPRPNVDLIKVNYPQYFFGRGKNGEIISVEFSAKIDGSTLRKAGVTPEMVAVNLAWLQEYCWTHMDSSEKGCTITIMDVKGISLTKAASLDNLAIVRQSTEMLDLHYPGRVGKILVVNAPRFFGPIFKVMTTVLPSTIRSQVYVINDHKELLQYIDIDQLPIQYGGNNKTPLEDSAEEESFREFRERVDQLAQGPKDTGTQA